MTAIVTKDDGSMVVETVDRPEPAPTEILIKVAAAGINPVDWKTRDKQAFNFLFDPAAPMILGWDVAGEVVALGMGVTRFKVGDRVFGMPRFPRPANAYAEYVVAGSREVVRTPDALSDIEAGALPLAVLTAWQAVVDTLKVGAGTKILIHAASGGVGHLAVQIAKAQGAEVWGTSSSKNHETLKELGVDHCIDYKAEKFEDIATDMDCVLDLYGLGDYPLRSVKCLKKGGQLLEIPSPTFVPEQSILDEAGVTSQWLLVEPDYASLEKVVLMIKEGTLKVLVGDTRPLEKITELLAIGEKGGQIGKLVATVK